MREITGGWETGDIVAEGFTGTGASVINSTGADQHKDRSGNGGTYCLRGGGGTNSARQIFQQTGGVRNLVEVWDRVCLRVSATTAPAGRIGLFVIYTGTTEIGSVSLDQTTQTISLYTSTATLLATSAAAVFPVNSYFTLDVHFRMLDAGGLYEAFVDGVSVVSFTGDTKPGTDTTVNSFGFAGNNLWYFDEFARNSLTILYTGGVGTFLAGDTITGGTSGATAIVTSVETSASRLVVRTWSGVAFQAGETITGSGSLATGLVSAPNSAYRNGFEPNSSRVGNGFVVARVPNGVGTTTQLTSSSGNPNWQNVDDQPPNATDYNRSGTADQYDTYAASSLPSSATAIVVVTGYAYSMRDGSQISNFKAVVRTNGADYFSTNNTALPTAYAAGLWQWNVNPATGTTWTVAEAGAAEPGFQVRT